MFGAAKTPFGGGGFGSGTSAFGSQPATPFGATSSGGLFGSTPAAGTFGTQSFGSTTPATGGLFGGTSTGNSLFGNKTTQSSGFGFGTTPSSGGLFGGSSGGGSSLFQTPSSNAFGTQKSTFGGFGATSSAFGTNTGSAFGTANSSGGLFGGGSSIFGQQGDPVGTTIKFQPVQSNEQTQKSGVSMTVKTQNQCITMMDKYKNKTIEELRLEDYAANRKGGSASAFGTGSGLFGGNTSNTGSSMFGNTSSKPGGFGTFGQTSTTGGLFGNTGSSLFGAKTTSSIFGGTTTTTQSGFGFGATSGGLFGNTSSSGGGLFGSAPTTSTGLFGGTSTFGQPAATQSAGLFGATSKPSFGFGASSGTGNTFSFGGANNTSSSGGLFGNSTNKPSFSFGAPTSGFGTSTGGFGTTTSSSGGLFGGTSSGGLFGKPLGFGTTSNTGSMFGSTGTTGGLNFGATNTSGVLNLGGANNLSGLGNINQSTLTALIQHQTMQQQLKAIANTPFGDSPLFRNLPSSTIAKTSQSSTLANSKANIIDTSQYKIQSRPSTRLRTRPVSSSSFGKSRLFEGLEDDGDFSPRFSTSHRSVKKLVIKDRSHQDLEPTKESQLKFRSFTDGDYNDESDLLAPSPSVVRSKQTTESPIQQKTFAPKFESTISELNPKDAVTPILKKTKNYVITPINQSGAESSLNQSNDNWQPEANGDNEDYTPPLCKITLRRPEYYTEPRMDYLDNLVKDDQCLVRDFIVGREGYGEVKFLGVTDVYKLNLDEIVIFRRHEVEVYPDNYPSKPDVGQELNKPSEITLLKVWPNDKSSHTPVKSPERLKASGFIEKIEEKTLAMDAVFVDYRPKEGAWVFKVNHFTRYGIHEKFLADDVDIDLQREAIKQRLKQHILRSKLQEEKEGMGLSDPDESSEQTPIFVEDDEGDGMDDDVEHEVGDAFDVGSENKENEGEIEEDFMPTSHQLGRVAHVQPFHIQTMKTSILYDDEEEYVPSPRTALKTKQLFSNKSIFSNSTNKSILGDKTYNVEQQQQYNRQATSFPRLDISKPPATLQNSLNASLFQPLSSESPGERARKMTKTTHLFKSGVVQTDIDSTATPLDSEPTPQNLYVKCRSFEMVPYAKSLMFGKALLFSDAGLAHGREFNVRWNNSLTFVHSGKMVGRVTSATKKQNPNIFSSSSQQSVHFGFSNMTVNVEQIKMNTNDGMAQFMENCLEISLKHTNFEADASSPISFLTLKSGTEAIPSYVEVANAFSQVAAEDEEAYAFKNHAQAWQLASALWGKQDLDDSNSLYEVHHARRRSLSKWLSDALREEINAEVEKLRVQDNGHLGVIFSRLTGQQIRSACQTARNNREHRLSLLLAQLCGDQHLKHYLRDQLDQWEQSNADKFIDEKRLKLYVLLSGMMVWKSNNHLINLCEDLDWKRCLALHLCYYCPPSSSIFDAFTEYQNAFRGTDTYEPYAAFPSPGYAQQGENKTKDLLYHMLALYCNRAHSLEKMLTPTTHTPNQLDYHLSWHLQRVLENIGYSHLTDERHSFLQYSYASQLENSGLWYWAVYVLMHLRNKERREYHVKELLQRYCRVKVDDESIEFSDVENFIVDKFQVPREWIHEAKALHAKYVGEHYKEAVHLIRACQWNRAHVTIIEHLAADVIIEEDHDTLRDLLQDIALPERVCTVKNWRIGGQVFLDYIMLHQKLEDIKTEQASFSAYNLEDMETEVASLINRISIMNVNTSRERLCQSEMARNCSNMLKVVFSEMNSQVGDTENEDNPKWSTVKVAPYVVKLPLPPDYYLKELRELLANFANEIEYDSPDEEEL